MAAAAWGRAAGTSTTIDEGAPLRDAGSARGIRRPLLSCLCAMLAACNAASNAGPAADAGSNAGPGAGSRSLSAVTFQPSMRPSTDCPTTSVPTSQCLVGTIAGCPGIEPITVRLKISDPPGPPIGTVILGTGGGGNGLYELFGPSAVNLVILPLLQRGYRVIQRGWDLQYGWLTGPGGGDLLGCRYASLLQAVHDNLHAPGTPLCVTGNSGGSAEISYALAHYGMGRIVDLAMPTSGPPMGRIDNGCLGSLQPGWLQECQALQICNGSASCQYSSAGPTGGPGGPGRDGG